MSTVGLLSLFVHVHVHVNVDVDVSVNVIREAVARCMHPRMIHIIFAWIR